MSENMNEAGGNRFVRFDADELALLGIMLDDVALKMDAGFSPLKDDLRTTVDILRTEILMAYKLKFGSVQIIQQTSTSNRT